MVGKNILFQIKAERIMLNFSCKVDRVDLDLSVFFFRCLGSNCGGHGLVG